MALQNSNPRQINLLDTVRSRGSVTVEQLADMLGVNEGQIEIGILWGPFAGYLARQKGNMTVTPLTKETGGPRLVYRMTMGVRAADQNWKRTLNRFIQDNQPEINKLLIGFGVPLLDERGLPISALNQTKRP